MTDTLHFFEWSSSYQTAEQMQDTHFFCLDSILKARTLPNSLLHESLFSHHQLPVEHTEALLRSIPSASSWAFIVVLVVLFFSCFLLKRYCIGFPSLITLAFDSPKMTRLLRENNINHGYSLSPIGFLVISLVALLGYYACTNNTVTPLGLHGFLLYLLLWGAGILLYFTRNGLERALGKIFNNEDACGIYINSNYAFNLIETLLLLPFTFFLFYSPYASSLFTACSWMLAILILIRFIRGLQLILTFSTGSRLYLFYYLCTLEIAPLSILLMALISQ